jgi:hypothetical protein
VADGTPTAGPVLGLRRDALHYGLKNSDEVYECMQECDNVGDDAVVIETT